MNAWLLQCNSTWGACLASPTTTTTIMSSVLTWRGQLAVCLVSTTTVPTRQLTGHCRDTLYSERLRIRFYNIKKFNDQKLQEIDTQKNKFLQKDVSNFFWTNYCKSDKIRKKCYRSAKLVQQYNKFSPSPLHHILEKINPSGPLVKVLTHVPILYDLDYVCKFESNNFHKIQLWVTAF